MRDDCTIFNHVVYGYFSSQFYRKKKNKRRSKIKTEIITVIFILGSSLAFANCEDILSDGVSKRETSILPWWQMNREDWIKAQFPDMGIQWTLSPDQQKVEWEDTKEAEYKAINDFLNLFDDPIAAFRKGQSVCAEEFPGRICWRTRDRVFAANASRTKFSFVTHTRGRVNNIEDARLAIIWGRKFGYREEDILFYIIKNYIIYEYMPEIWARTLDLEIVR